MFDGRETTIFKSPDQADVTPSVIYIDKKGHRLYGRKAYQRAMNDEKNSASLFKRFMGTGKVFEMESSGVRMTPVECSAELLRVLFGYLPEEIRSDPDTVTVITVPSSFNQMKKDATLEAAKMAGIGKTALMQEPVAAVMSVLKKDSREMRFVIYDLGGGTFDVSVAQYIGGHVNVLAQGGREMCGGRDIDRWIYRNLVVPYLMREYHLPDDFGEDPAYLNMKKKVLFAVEEAKIALSGSAEDAPLWIDESTLAAKDLDGTDMAVDLVLTRADLEPFINEMAEETSELVKETIQRASLEPEEIEQIVFVGGPTMYAPLREKVVSLLGIEKGTAVNPMTAVAEGASIYAESIDWESDRHRAKESFEELPKKDEDVVTIRYESRTTSEKARIAVLFSDKKERYVRFLMLPDQEASGNGEAESGPQDTGSILIKGQGIVELPLPAPGSYSFRAEVRNTEDGEPFFESVLRITRTIASIRSIPASHSIAVKALDRVGGTPVPVYLVHVNDPLPKEGTVTFRAAQQLVGGSMSSLTFSLWEGEIRDPVDDNRYIGTFRIPGKVIHSGVVPVGAEIICDYEMNEAGNLTLGASIPCVGLIMNRQNFYSRMEGQLDFRDTSVLVKETNDLLERTAQMKQSIVDPELDELRRTLLELSRIFAHSTDAESIAEAESTLRASYRKIAQFNQRYAGAVRSRDLQSMISRFRAIQDKAMPDEISAFENLVEAARYSIDLGSSDFTEQLDEMSSIVAAIRWRQDDFIRSVFMNMILWPGNYTDRAAFDHLRAEGLTCIENNDMGGLRSVVSQLAEIRVRTPAENADRFGEEVGVYKA